MSDKLSQGLGGPLSEILAIFKPFPQGHLVPDDLMEGLEFMSQLIFPKSSKD